MTQTIGFLIFPNFQLLDAAGPIAAFEIASRQAGGGAYALTILSPAGGLVESSSGARMASEPFAEAPILDTLVIAGGFGVDALREDQAALALVRRAAAGARRVASVCSGALVLAQAGLLDGRGATTHWSRTTEFMRRYPAVRLSPDRIYVKDGPVWTSAGISAGVDLALALIEEDLGEPLARRTAQQLVVYHRRPGGQSQFSPLLEMERPGGRFSGLLAWARERLREALTVDQLADQAAMSPRHFARAFAAETGVTPAKAVERLRLDAARARVEDSAAPIDRIALDTGFGDPERMRRAFVRAFGQPPQALRRLSRAAA